MPRAARYGLVLVIFSLAGLLLPIWRSSGQAAADRDPRYSVVGKVRTWWDPVSPTQLAAVSTFTQFENIHRENYVGPEACRECHVKKYKSWSGHSHSKMNALADESTVLGDFSGDSPMHYLGGTILCYRDNGDFMMRLDRGGVRRVYRVDQTIGSRFFQYYVGTQIEGPEPAEHPFYVQDQVLPVGYWLDYGEWVPTVHIDGDEAPDGRRSDPFNPDLTLRDSPLYARTCNHCHTTFPLGDMLLRFPETIGKHAPVSFQMLGPPYLARNHPQVWPPERDPARASIDEFVQAYKDMVSLEAPQHAVTLGVSCEACHLGGRAHVEKRLSKPYFFPSGRELFYEQNGRPVSYQRTRANRNWICSRCHSGGRPRLAAGMSTWNSTEAEDAFRGSCYSQLACVDCHDPHVATGKQWTRKPGQDDAACLRCHEGLRPADERVAHTHHPMGSAGSRCMNCHMPKLNEGMQDIVRTHMIFSPTNRAMIESNEPNACNQCHVKETIDWTLAHLGRWYGAEYAPSAIVSAYPSRDEPATIGWLRSRRDAVRLIAADALTAADARWALPELVECLDDPYLINRQFARRGIERMLGVELSDYGYRFYMSPDERRLPVRRVREALIAEPIDR